MSAIDVESAMAAPETNNPNSELQAWSRPSIRRLNLAEAASDIAAGTDGFLDKGLLS